MTEKTVPFEEILETFRGEEPISIPSLFRLSDISDADFEALTRLWSELPDERRRVIVRHLADISEENFQVNFERIFEFCLEDQAPMVRMAALDGLWDSEETRLIPPIIQLMQDDPERDVRALAAATLGHYVVLVQWDRLPERYEKRIVTALLAIYDDEEIPQAVRRPALESLGAAAHPRVSQLIEDAYDSADADMQLSALFAMGRSADPRWLQTVIDELQSPVGEMRLEAARAAGGIGRSDAIAELADLIFDEDLEIRLVAVNSLGQIGGGEAQRILEDLIDDPDAVELAEAIEDALEQMSWAGAEIDLSGWPWSGSDIEADSRN